MMVIIKAGIALLPLVLLVSACGDSALEGGAPSGGAAAGGAGGAETSGGAGGTDETGGGGAPSCADPAVMAELTDFLSRFEQAASALAGHGASNEAAGFFIAPGLPEPPAIIATFAGLFMACTEPVLFDPFCDQGRCTQIECTGDGAGWSYHFSLDETVSAAGFSLASVDIAHHWADGESGTTFDFATEATGPGDRSWNATGSGALGQDSATLELTFPTLFGSPAVLTYEVTESSHEGSLIVDGVEIAAVGPTGALEPTGDCP